MLVVPRPSAFTVLRHISGVDNVSPGVRVRAGRNVGYRRKRIAYWHLPVLVSDVGLGEGAAS